VQDMTRNVSATIFAFRNELRNVDTCLTVWLPDVPVSRGQSPDSDSCPRRKSVPGFL
jgi:hypothetical protein